jgi:hypothetical protein
MLLYTKVHEQIESIIKAQKLAGGYPVSYNMNFGIMYLGDIDANGGLFEVQLKAGKKELGWLYSKSSIVLFKYNGSLFELWLSDLKEISEAAFEAKKFKEVPEIGFLHKNKETGGIYGYLSASMIIDHAKIIPQ